MENVDNQENKSLFDDSNEKKFSNFSSYLKDNCNENSKSTSPKNCTNKTIKINLNETNFLDDFQYESKINEKEEKDFSFNDFTSIENQGEEEQFEFDSIINYEYNFLNYLEKLKYLINNYEKQFLKNIKKPIIKCLLSEFEENNNRECSNIPLITKKKYCISFACDNHNNKKNIIIRANFLLKNINKIFIESPRLNQNDNNENLSDSIILLKENIVKFEFNINHLRRKIGVFKTHIRKNLNEKIKVINDFLNDYITENKCDESFKAQSLKRFKNIYFPFLEKLNLLIYLIMINRLIYEFKYFDILSYKNRIILLINLKNASELIERKNKNFDKSGKKRINRKNKKLNSFKFNWIIEFYSNEEIKSNINKNVFIATNELGFIYILLINFKSTNEILTEEITNAYELINTKKIENFKPNKITKLKKLFKTKETDNYFIINSMQSARFGKALIINVIENNNYIDIKEKYKIEIVQLIKDVNGLYTSIEFFYKEKNYLLSFYNNFYLWIYNSELNQIEKNSIENEINNDEQDFNYGPLIYEEIKKLFIIQCFLPKTKLIFYKLIEDNDRFNFDKIDKTIQFKEEESFFKINNNYFIYNNRYLLLCSGKMKNNKSGGIYTIDLEKFEIISFHQFQKCIAINSMIPSKRNNIILVSSIFSYKKFYKYSNDKFNEKSDNQVAKIFERGRMLTIEIKNENNKILFKIKNFSEGPFFFINCKNLILDEYIFTSFHKDNNLIKLKEDGKFITYFKINI